MTNKVSVASFGGRHTVDQVLLSVDQVKDRVDTIIVCVRMDDGTLHQAFSDCDSMERIGLLYAALDDHMGALVVPAESDEECE